MTDVLGALEHPEGQRRQEVPGGQQSCGRPQGEPRAPYGEKDRVVTSTQTGRCQPLDRATHQLIIYAKKF